jgi:four helix bundle protein
MDDFEQFDAFQRSRDFAKAVAELVNNGAFSSDPGFVNHLRKTLLSIYSNIGEGFERDGNREFVQFLSIAKASIGEVRGQLYYAVDFGYLRSEKLDELNELAKAASRCLGGLMRYLNRSKLRGRKFKDSNDDASLKRRKNG